jgi:phosphatidylethanolamine-binding protein (PEBP) family uncharacterized protein
MSRATTATRVIAVAVSAALVTVACNDDGREMREPGPDQTASIVAASSSSLGISSVAPDTDPGSMGHDDGDNGADGFDVALPWPDGERIPRRYTCAGRGVAPTIVWDGLPAATVEVAVIVRVPGDDDTVHLAVVGIAPTVTRLDARVDLDGLIVGTNDADELGWTPPCPTDGASQLVRFEVHALGQQVEAIPGDPASLMTEAVRLASIATAVGTGIAVD